MNWLDDALIEQFLDSALLRVTVTPVHRFGVSEAYVVLSVEDKVYLGTVTRAGNHWNAFTNRNPKGIRVRGFSTALQLIELEHGAEWEESTDRSRPKKKTVEGS